MGTELGTCGDIWGMEEWRRSEGTCFCHLRSVAGSFSIDENFSCSLSNSPCCGLDIWKHTLVSPATEETKSSKMVTSSEAVLKYVMTKTHILPKCVSVSREFLFARGNNGTWGTGSSFFPCYSYTCNYGVLRKDMSDSLSFTLLSLRVKDIVLFKRFVALRNLACCCTASFYN